MHSRRNVIALIISFVVALALIGTLTVFMGGKPIGNLLIGETSASEYPFSLQNVMHVLFFVGFGQLWIRWLSAYEERVFLDKAGFLPSEPGTVLATDGDIDEIRVRVENAAIRADAFYPELINSCITQYFKTRSVSDTLAVLNSTQELNLHKLDLRYSMTRYVVWAIPTFGFIGTVIGIAQALGNLNIDKLTGAHKAEHFAVLTSNLGMAFNTTIVALGLSAILVFVLHWVQGDEELAVNQAGSHVLQNLINKIKPHDQDLPERPAVNQEDLP
jgi:hypothetical protein